MDNDNTEDFNLKTKELNEDDLVVKSDSTTTIQKPKKENYDHDDDSLVVSDNNSKSDEEQLDENIEDEFTEKSDELSVDLLSGDVKKIDKWLAARFDGLTKDQINEQLNDKTSWLYRIYRMGQLFGPFSEAKRVQDFAKEENFKDKEDFSYRYVRDNEVISGLAKFDNGENKDKKVSGIEAYRLMSRKGTIFRYTLYNSGIAVEFREPTLSELTSFVQQTRQSEQSYSYLFGYCMYLFDHLYMTQAVLNLLFDCIVFSTYSRFRDKQDFFSKISLHDLSALIIGFTKTLYPDGFEGFSKTCLRNIEHPDDDVSCKHVDVLKLNITKLFYTRFYKLTEDQIKFTSTIRSVSNKAIKENDRIHYVKGVNKSKQISYGKYRLTLRSPSIQEWSDSGDDYIDYIQRVMKSDNSYVEDLEQYLISNRMRQYLIWIDQIDVYTDETHDELYMSTSNKEAILLALEKSVLIDKSDRDKFNKELTGYMNDTQLTFIGYKDEACPSCGYVSDDTTGFTFVDPISMFFMIVTHTYLEFTKNTMI